MWFHNHSNTNKWRNKNTPAIPQIIMYAIILSLGCTDWCVATLKTIAKNNAVNMFITFIQINITIKFWPPTPLGDGGVRIYFFKKKSLEWRWKKSNHNTTSLIQYTPFIPHTITLKNVVYTFLLYVVILPYLVCHTLCFEAQKKLY